jgi:hypothetical protein
VEAPIRTGFAGSWAAGATGAAPVAGAVPVAGAQAAAMTMQRAQMRNNRDERSIRLLLRVS